MLFNKKFGSCVLLLSCFFVLPNQGRTATLALPELVKAQALKAQDACFTKMSQAIEENEGSCGNSGCAAAFNGCYVEGESVVITAINDLVESSSGHLSEVCQAGIDTLANEASNDNPWLDRVMQQLPVTLDGDPIILYRLYFYELIYKTVNNRDCKS